MGSGAKSTVANSCQTTHISKISSKTPRQTIIPGEIGLNAERSHLLDSLRLRPTAPPIASLGDAKINEIATEE